jgi:hypothetical protein
MKKFSTWEEADDFAKNAQTKFKQQLNFLNNYTFKIDVVRSSMLSGRENINYKGKMKLIPKKFKPMIFVGSNVVYLVCDVVYEDLAMISGKPPHRDFMEIVKSGDFNNKDIKKLFPSLKAIPKDYFKNLSKLIGLSDFQFMEDEIKFS